MHWLFHKYASSGHTDLNLNEKVIMDVKITKTDIVFTEKGERNDLKIKINRHNLETTVTDGAENESIYWGYGS